MVEHLLCKQDVRGSNPLASTFYIMKELPTQSRAYVCKVPNRFAKSSASKEYFQVFIEDSAPLLFTSNELASAAKRAEKNPEDIVHISFVEPETPVKQGVANRLMAFLFKS